ncbi:MAG: tripartite tricarboxylate transporter substrate binding protein [Burkholderiales bacterium]|nr:tripartite tricarboxylate transporter substrate binding protein [Burkholderiales bacterium]
MFTPTSATRLACAAAALGCALAACAAESDYPHRPVRLIVPYPPGGGTDPPARLIGAWLADRMGQTVVVDNRPGAGAVVGHSLGAQAAADGYTLLFGTSGGLVVGPAYNAKVPYDGIKSYAHVGLLTDAPYLLIVHAATPVKSVQELVALAKAQPGKILLGSPGMGTPNHLGIELLKSMTKAEFVHVPYKGGGPALLDVVSGRTHALFGGVTYTGPAIASGKARALAVGHTERIRWYPDLPAIAEWLPGFNVSTWYGILAPAGTPAPVVTKLNAEIRNAVVNAGFVKQLDALGLVPTGSTPEQLRERIRNELARWSKVIDEAGIRSQ